MLVIRLLRTGKENQTQYKIVVTDKKNPPRGGRFVEIVGSFSPMTKIKNFKIERIKYWISVGAKPSPTVFNLLIKEKIIEGKKISKQKKSKKPIEAQKTQEAPKVETPVTSASTAPETPATPNA